MYFPLNNTFFLRGVLYRYIKNYLSHSSNPSMDYTYPCVCLLSLARLGNLFVCASVSQCIRTTQSVIDFMGCESKSGHLQS